MKTNLLLNNKNIFAFALCFAAFTAQAHDSVESAQISENNVETTETLSVMTNVDGQNVTIDALVISLENAKKILNAEQVQELITIFNETINREDVTVDGILFTMNEITYFVKTSEFIDEVTKNNVNASDVDDVTTTALVHVNDSDDLVNTDNFDAADNSTEEVDSQE